MKKLNNKGMSLIELIISFSLVCVAVIYFFETLFITNKIFRTTKEDTKKYVDKAYIFNIIDYYVHTDIFKTKLVNNVDLASVYLDEKLKEFTELDSNFRWNKYIKYDPAGNVVDEPNIKDLTDGQKLLFSYRFTMNDKEYYYFFATNVKTDTISD